MVYTDVTITRKVVVYSTADSAEKLSPFPLSLPSSLDVDLKGQKRAMVFSLFASYPEQKERILNFFHVVPIFTE